MDDRTINSEVTLSGENATVLAGRYRIIRQLGQGGMGSVWLAEDTKLDGFKVAIKMLPSVLVNNKRAYAQVKAEALVSLKLSHPNIVTVRAFEEESGSPFLVMDYVDGQTLDDYLAEKGKLTEDETVKLLKPVAAALDYAHSQGVVHRDVKPGNIMIRKDGTPFVLDFGIAREIQETMTRVTGKLSSGTLLYMSPEQLNGDAPKPAQDIYSFAAMVYECLKGEPPFSRGQVEFQILNKEPEPLLGGSDLARSILRGLAKAPVARPGNCMGVVAPVVVLRPRPKPTFESVSVPKEDVRFIPPRDRAMFAGSESVSSCSTTRSKDPSRFAPPPHELRATSRGRFGMWIAILVLVSAGCAIWLVTFTDHHVFKSKTTNTAVPASVPVPPQTKVDAVNVRTEALLQIAVCRKIDKSDGFNAKIEECEKTITSGRSAFDSEDWSEAVKFYNEAVRQCALVIEMNKDRDRAREAAKAMERQARAAKDAEADKYAKERFDAAKKQVEQARQDFGEMNFNAAADGHNVAAELFEKALAEAKTNRTRQEQEEIQRLRQLLASSPKAVKHDRHELDVRLGDVKKNSPAKEDDLNALLKDLEGQSCPNQPIAEQPTVNLTASLNGVPKRAFIIDGIVEKNRTTPVQVKLNVPVGGTWSCQVRYEERDGTTYYGKGSCCVKNGNQALDVKLYPCAPAIPVYDRPEGMNFCRHCRAPLTSYQKVPRNCPKCARNLFGN